MMAIIFLLDTQLPSHGWLWRLFESVNDQVQLTIIGDGSYCPLHVSKFLLILRLETSKSCGRGRGYLPIYQLGIGMSSRTKRRCWFIQTQGACTLLIVYIIQWMLLPCVSELRFPKCFHHWCHQFDTALSEINGAKLCAEPNMAVAIIKYRLTAANKKKLWYV